MRAFIWWAIYSYLDLVYLVEVLSRFCGNPKCVYLKLVKDVLKYVFEIQELGLIFNREIYTPDDMMGYINSDFAGLKTDQKST